MRAYRRYTHRFPAANSPPHCISASMAHSINCSVRAVASRSNLRRAVYPSGHLQVRRLVLSAHRYRAARATFTATKPVAVTQANTTPVTLHTYAGNFTSVNIDIANAVAYRNLINLEEITFTDRNPTASFDLERPTLAQKDFFTTVLNGTTGAFALTHGTVAGNKVQISAPLVQLTNVTMGSANGLETLTLPGDLIPNVGNDELVITVL